MIFGYEVPPWFVNLLGSAAVSLVISILVFSIGVRVGKERVDRAVLRTKYEEIYGHFKSLLSSIETDQLRTWTDYPLKGNAYCPLIRASKFDGSINLLPDRLAKRFLRLELDVVNGSMKIRQEIQEKFVPMVKEALENEVKARLKQMGSHKAVRISITRFATMSREDLIAIFEKKEKDTYIAIDLATARGKSNQSSFRHDMMLEKSEKDFALDLFDRIQSMKEVDYSQLEALSRRLRAEMKVVAARIKDPHPLRDTVFGSFLDFTK